MLIKLRTNLLLVLLLLNASSAALTKEKVLVQGKVTDQLSRPVPGSQIIVRNQKDGFTQFRETNHAGEFTISHDPCSAMSIEVVPAHKTGLTNAVLRNISGESNNRVIVMLHKGFLVSGRIISCEQGERRNFKKSLKDLEVRAYPEDVISGDTVRGGGFAKTAGDGTFHFMLTAGPKLLVITNQHYPSLAHSLKYKCHITTDIFLPDIIMPPLEKTALDKDLSTQE